jgi:hypothetical protein
MAGDEGAPLQMVQLPTKELRLSMRTPLSPRTGPMVIRFLLRSIRSIRIHNLLEPARAAVAVLGKAARCKALTLLGIRIERIKRIERRRQDSTIPSSSRRRKDNRSSTGNGRGRASIWVIRKETDTNRHRRKKLLRACVSKEHLRVRPCSTPFAVVFPTRECQSAP